MKLEISNGAVRPFSLFKFVALGYGLGAGVVFIPATLIVAASNLLGAFGQTHAVEQSLLAVVLAPFVLGGQALAFAALITLGLWLYTRWRRIEIVQR